MALSTAGYQIEWLWSLNEGYKLMIMTESFSHLVECNHFICYGL